MMESSFLQRYLEAFHRIEGWFSFDAALMFMAYNGLLRRQRPAGNALEIGVHHGLSSIAIASLRGEGKRFTAIDLFEERQSENISRSGEGKRSLFEENLKSFHGEIAFVDTVARASGEVAAAGLGSGYTFCHIDGGHSRAETCGDLSLCHAITAPGGLIAIDDYFNPEFPGVAEGAIEFMLRNEGALAPLAIGYQKVLFQKAPESGLNAEFSAAFPCVERREVTMWGTRTLLLGKPLRQYFDLYASSPDALVPLGAAGTRALLKPLVSTARAKAGARLEIPVSLENRSSAAFPAGKNVFGMSYHVLSASGQELVHDNPRAWINTPLAPGGRASVRLPVRAPSEPGPYRLEIDLVWEGVMWFKDVGNPTAFVDLSVS